MERQTNRVAAEERNASALPALGLLLFLAFCQALPLAITAAESVKAAARPARPLIAPPEPRVAPSISDSYPTDTDGDRIDDQLVGRAERAESASRAAVTAQEKAQAKTNINELVEVELVFKRQITQQHIDAFLAAGGQVSYIYQAVSYGWNGRIPLGKARAIPALMGNALALMEEPKKTKMHMDTATRTGRVRPIWSPGFAGNVAGFDGDPNITIAICDTGVDESHTDLNGRRVYWQDFTTDAEASPIDLLQHGSHVMGIATGTGASGGSGTSTLFFTDEGSLSGVPNGSFYPNPIELPASSVTVTFTAEWNGGGSTTLYCVYHSKGVSGSYTVEGSGVTGTSPLTLNLTFTPTTTRVYSPALISNGSMTDYFVKCQVSNYPGVGDGFNKFRGVAPGCNWAGAKVFTSAGDGINTWTTAALDDLVANRISNNIKVINLSLGTIGNPGIDATERDKVNTAVNNGIVVAVSAGNDGSGSTAARRTIDDPGRAAMALTVAAANDVNQLTDYSSEGFSSPGSTEDYKPDLMAPGGSGSYYSAILSVDSNSGDGAAFTDQQANDHLNIQGTSMASPFAAGCAALVIDALQQSGVVWDFNSSQHSRYVKMVLCATASESNANRENGANNPTLQRAAAGPNSFPAGKDKFEGYGMINPDAAVSAVSQTYTLGATANDSLGPNATDARVWARKVMLASGQRLIPTLTVPAAGDFDLYLYSSTPSAKGTPTILTSSTAAGNGVNANFNYLAPSNLTAFLVVKRISGSGSFTLTSPPAVVANFTASPTNGAAPLTVSFTNLSTGATNYTWTFGDGKTSTATNAVNTYTNAGSYTVRLTAIGPSGTNSLTNANYIVVTNAPLAAHFVGGPTNGVGPLTVSFTNLSTGASNYSWVFGDGKTSTATNTSNTYTNVGTYTVKLSAVGGGATNSLTRTNYIVVINPLPVANFVGGPTNGKSPLSVVFTNLSTGATNYSWNFGDGHVSTATNAANTYSNAGSYTVSLQAVGLGGTNTIVRNNYVVLSNAPPVLAPIADQIVLEETELTFAASATDPDVAQTLLFSLDPTVPEGASINATNGMFTWTPSLAFASTTNSITLRVTDDGSPVAFDTHAFNITVVAKPRLLSIAESPEGFFTLVWQVFPGRTYDFQFKENVTDANWTTLITNYTATTSSAAITNDAGTNFHGFHRVLDVTAP